MSSVHGHNYVNICSRYYNDVALPCQSIYSHKFILAFYVKTIIINPNPLGILARNLPESSKIHRCTFGNMSLSSKCIFVDLTYSALMACTSCQVAILPHLKGCTSFQQCWFFPNKCPLEVFGGFEVVRVNKMFNPNSLDNKGSCWILKDCYCSVTMLRELGLKHHH